MKDYHNLLFPYAYNILGSSDDAKDAVQEVLSNFITSPREGIVNEKGYLIKSVINQSINIKNRQKKLRHGEVWLPEPLATEEADTDLNLRDIVSYSLLVLLERLNPKERAAFILKEGFGYSHEEIAEVLSSNVENSRKLLSRAREKLHQSQQPAEETLSLEFLEKYVQAIRNRDTQTLESLLSSDIAFYADGGDTVKVIKKICTGLHEVVELLMVIHQQFQQHYRVVPARINHQLALLYYDGDQIKSCQVLELSPEGNIQRINTVLDPEKLKALGRH